MESKSILHLFNGLRAFNYFKQTLLKRRSQKEAQQVLKDSSSRKNHYENRKFRLPVDIVGFFSWIQIEKIVEILFTG